MTPEAKQEVERFLENGEKLRAIKYLKDKYGFSLEQSKILVEAMDGVVHTGRYLQTGGGLDEPAKARVSDLLRSGKKFEAIKFVKDSGGMPLKQARQIVEELDRSVHPGGKTSMLQGPARLVFMIFGSVGLLLLVAAGYIYYDQVRSIEKSDLVTGHVIRMVTKPDGMAAPVIAYEWNDQEWLHASTTYSSPPAYTVDEAVPIYVNREDASDITVDTFMGRWFIPTILGSLGFVFTAVSVLVGYIGRHRDRQMMGG